MSDIIFDDVIIEAKVSVLYINSYVYVSENETSRFQSEIGSRFQTLCQMRVSFRFGGLVFTSKLGTQA